MGMSYLYNCRITKEMLLVCLFGFYISWVFSLVHIILHDSLLYNKKIFVTQYYHFFTRRCNVSEIRRTYQTEHIRQGGVKKFKSAKFWDLRTVFMGRKRNHRSMSIDQLQILGFELEFHEFKPWVVGWTRGMIYMKTQLLFLLPIIYKLILHVVE